MDFPQLLVRDSASAPGVILFRGGNYSNREMCELLERVLNEIAPETLEESICVVDKHRIRVTRLPVAKT
jgi:predicted nuclease of predicted toxin-antitoxin system